MFPIDSEKHSEVEYTVATKPQALETDCRVQISVAPITCYVALYKSFSLDRTTLLCIKL